MYSVKTILALVSLAIGMVSFSNPGSQQTKAAIDSQQGLDRYIAVLKSGTPQQKAAAAYKLGQQHSSAAPAVGSLADLLGDTTEVDASQYRRATREHRPTLGEEAAAALVHIGRPAIDSLVRTLKTSPSAEARKNAAWALGALHDTGTV
jgi:HEAT repeat protein